MHCWNREKREKERKKTIYSSNFCNHIYFKYIYSIYIYILLHTVNLHTMCFFKYYFYYDY